MDIHSSSRLQFNRSKIADDVRIGPDVIIECEYLELAEGVAIGMPQEGDFRAGQGVRVKTESLILDQNVQLGRCLSLKGGVVHLGKGVTVRDWNTINVRKHLFIDQGGTIASHCEIAGIDIKIGRKLWMLPYVKIGGGSSFEVHSSLEAGHFLHIGMYSILNTARPVTLGNEVGLGTRTALYTHGAYASQLDGFPVAFGEISIGDRSWLPGATVNPAVSIGSDCVIGVGSVVTKDVPSGALAAGIPARIIKENAYPRVLSVQERKDILSEILHEFAEICADRLASRNSLITPEIKLESGTFITFLEEIKSEQINDFRLGEHKRLIILSYGRFPEEPGYYETFIDLKHRFVEGVACPISDRLLNQLRRHGIRFYCDNIDGQYEMWPETA